MPSPGSRSRRRLWPRRAALVLLALVVALLLLEIGLRAGGVAVRRGYPDGLFVDDGAGGYRLAPDFEGRHVTGEYAVTIRTNAHGFRDDPLGPPRADTRRILALGDSFGFGHGVEAEQAYPALLETLLPRTEVVNAAAPGYGTRDELSLLRAEAGRLAPDTVLLAVYVGNDFRDNATDRFGRLAARSGALVTLGDDEPAWWTTLEAAVAVHSRAILFLAQRLYALSLDEQDVRRRQCDDLAWGAGFGIAMLEQTYSRQADDAFGRTVDLLGQVVACCRQRGLRLLVALLPGPLQYDDRVWAEAVALCGLQPERYERDRPNRRLAAWAREAGVEVVDLLPAFREAVAADPALQPYLGVHFDARGHRLAAQVLAAALAE